MVPITTGRCIITGRAKEDLQEKIKEIILPVKTLSKTHLKDFISYEELKGYTPDTIRRKEQYLKRYLSFINQNHLITTKETIQDFITYLHEEHKSPEKISLHITYINQFYNYLIERDITKVNPASTIDKPLSIKTRDSYLFTEDDIKNLFTVSMTHHKRKSMIIMVRDRAIMELFYSTGMRLSELTQLDVNDIDLKHREVKILHGKGLKQRVVPIGEKALYYLKQYLEIRHYFIKLNKEYNSLFISREGNRLAGLSIRRMIHRRKKEANIITKGTTHIFRRTCATHMITHGAPIESISKLLGHELLQTTEQYTIIDIHDLKEKHKTFHPRD